MAASAGIAWAVTAATVSPRMVSMQSRPVLER
jgi:hypothetical protein